MTLLRIILPDVETLGRRAAVVAWIQNGDPPHIRADAHQQHIAGHIGRSYAGRSYETADMPLAVAMVRAEQGVSW